MCILFLFSFNCSCAHLFYFSLVIQLVFHLLKHQQFNREIMPLSFIFIATIYLNHFLFFVTVDAYLSILTCSDKEFNYLRKLGNLLLLHFSYSEIWLLLWLSWCEVDGKYMKKSRSIIMPWTEWYVQSILGLLTLLFFL